MLGEFYMASFYRNENLKKCLLIVLWGVTLFAIGFGIQFYRGLGLSLIHSYVTERRKKQ